ncbi:MAG TPA: hypothetical protein VGH87_22780 [Polyangiaceae bacterium]|jgi:hypothetical protein|nr:hypothetical protein [Polyangiaceae bacterium]
MSDEPRFPPPHGEEPVGYRDAGAPVSDDKPEPPVPSSSSAVLRRGKLVVASRPDDPDVAIAKAFTPPRRKLQPTSPAVIAFIVIALAIYVGLAIADTVRRPRRPVPTVNGVQR